MAKVLLDFLFIAVLLTVCWILMEYWLGKRRTEVDEEMKQLRFGSRTAFALSRFWKRVDEGKHIPKETLKEEAERVYTDRVGAVKEPLHEQEKSNQCWKDIPNEKKKYNMKENM